MPKARAVDVWANYWPSEFFANYRPLGEVYDKLGLAGQVTDLDRLAEEAEANGVDKVVMSATAVTEASDNATVARAISKYPDLLVGCASVDPATLDAAAQLRRSLQDDNFRAFKILPFLHGLAPNDERYYPLYDICMEFGVPVLFLTGHQALNVPSELGRPAHLDDVALRCPDLKMIAGPGGWPWTDELIALAWKHPNLYIHTVFAPAPLRDIYLPPQLRDYMGGLGPNKVMWGTGYPFMGHTDPLQALRGGAIPEETCSAFLWDNAAHVWGWK